MLQEPCPDLGARGPCCRGVIASATHCTAPNLSFGTRGDCSRAQGQPGLPEPRRNASLGPAGRQNLQDPSSPPRPPLTCDPRGPAAARALRATRKAALSATAAAIFYSPAALWPHGGHWLRPRPGSGSCHPIGARFWARCVLLALLPLWRRNLPIPLAPNRAGPVSHCVNLYSDASLNSLAMK